MTHPSLESIAKYFGLVPYGYGFGALIVSVVLASVAAFACGIVEAVIIFKNQDQIAEFKQVNRLFFGAFAVHIGIPVVSCCGTNPLEILGGVLHIINIGLGIEAAHIFLTINLHLLPPIGIREVLIAHIALLCFSICFVFVVVCLLIKKSCTSKE